MARTPAHRPTMEDVAKLAGVSRSLVSLVMHDSPKVSEASRQAVLDAADRLGYRPNILARNLASRRTSTIGVILENFHNPFNARVFDAIDASAAEASYRVLVASGTGRSGAERQGLETFLALRVDGLILVGPRLSGTEIGAASRSVPLVTVSRSVRSGSADSVSNHDRLGARLVVEHLLEKGHRHIAHIDGGVGAGARARRSGFLASMEAAGLAASAVVVGGDYTEASGLLAGQMISSMNPRPTAVFCANDLTAVGALEAFDRAGLRVPEDIAIVGHDNTALSALQHLDLTTVDQADVEMGRLAFELLLERMTGTRSRQVHRQLVPKLVVRGSSEEVRG